MATSEQDLQRQIHQGLSQPSPARLAFTRRAFRMLPSLDNPRILDVGCGAGGPTLELARLSGGQVIGLDIDQAALDQLNESAREAGLSDEVQAVYGSMLDIEFPDESFDILWAEGSANILGFEQALGAWRRLLKPRGFLVVHEMAWLQPDPPQEIRDRWQASSPGIRTVPEYVAQVAACGYDPIGSFPLPEDFWWVEYYARLEARIQALRVQYTADPSCQRLLDREQQEVDLYKRNSRWYGSAFLVMQKPAA